MSNETNETPIQGRKVGIARFLNCWAATVAAV